MNWGTVLLVGAVLYYVAMSWSLALGMVLVIATRGIDLSVGAVMAISGAIAASLADAHGPRLRVDVDVVDDPEQAAAPGAEQHRDRRDGEDGRLGSFVHTRIDRRHREPGLPRIRARVPAHRGEVDELPLNTEEQDHQQRPKEQQPAGCEESERRRKLRDELFRRKRCLDLVTGFDQSNDCQPTGPNVSGSGLNIAFDPVTTGQSLPHIRRSGPNVASR